MSWQTVQTQGIKKPGSISDHTSVVYKNKMYLYGGSQGLNTNSTLFSLDVTTNLWEPVRTKAGPGQDGTQAPECDEHTAVVWNDDMVIFGGFIGGERVRCVHKYNFTRGDWTIVQFDEKDPQPVARAGHAAALLDDHMYIFGGKNNDDFMMNDIWRFNLTNNEWEHLKCNEADAPRGRAGHSMAVYKNHIIMFGGLYEITRELNDMYVFNVQKNEWRRLFKSTNEDNMSMT